MSLIAVTGDVQFLMKAIHMMAEIFCLRIVKVTI